MICKKAAGASEGAVGKGSALLFGSAKFVISETLLLTA